MRTLVIYDSWYGDTRKVAEEIARGIASATGVDPGILEVDHVPREAARGLDLLVIGSPNHFGHPTRKVRQLLRSLAVEGPMRADLAVFDTCFVEDTGKVTTQLAELARPLRTRESPEVPKLSVVVDAMRGPIRPKDLARAREFGEELGKAAARRAAAIPVAA